MKFKLDENLGARTVERFRSRGHDIHTVASEQLSGASDRRIFETCALEGRCLVTLDLDFADVLRFPPETSAGIAVIRAPGSVSLALLCHLIDCLLNMAEAHPIAQQLWIVEPNRIRVHLSDGD